MERLTSCTKRKKRRTRRCLDEIRNRLRRKCGNSFEHSMQNTKSCILESKELEKRLITMDRLTLKAMFPNAIRSETVTRPVLQDIKQKHVNLVDVVKENIAKKDTFPLDQNYLCNNMKTSASLYNNVYPECGKHSLCKETDDEAKLSSSLVLFSPADSINKAVTLNKTVNEEDAVSSETSSSRTSQNVRHRYEELMDEIPSYIRHLGFSVNKEDAIKKTINNLQKLYMEDCKKKCKDNVMKSTADGCILNTNKTFGIGDQLIVENPLDYMRLKGEQNRGSSLESLCDSPSPGGSSARSPASPAPCAAQSAPGLLVGGVPYDTPDYNYYPHRLK